MKILIINGPNLGQLGKREVDVYGTETLEQVRKKTQNSLSDQNVTLDWFQSNLEGEIVEKIHFAEENYQGLIINPGGYSHTSVAILDALKILSIPKVEVHLSQVYQREEFRTQLLTAKGCDMIMSGLGTNAYHIATLAILLKEK